MVIGVPRAVGPDVEAAVLAEVRMSLDCHHDLYSYGLHSYGLCIYGPYRYDLYRYGLYILVVYTAMA